MCVPREPTIPDAMQDLPALWYKPGVRSMTGYGRGKSEVEGSAITVEIRSVNHRFLDLKLRGAALDPRHEETLRKRIGVAITRGALSVSIRLDRQASQAAPHIDVDAAERVYSDLRSLAETLGTSTEIPVALVVGQPGVMVTVSGESEAQAAATSAGILEAADAAVSDLVAMRTAEGAALQTDIESRLETLKELASKLGELAKTGPAEAQKRLEDRLGKLLKNSKVEVDESRIAQEVAVLADKLDVTEELVRLSSHFEQLALLVRDPKPVGRKLDFLVQELGREFNTVTSKSQSANVARLVVDAKAELEKIREQVQNVE